MQAAYHFPVIGEELLRLNPAFCQGSRPHFLKNGLKAQHAIGTILGFEGRIRDCPSLLLTYNFL
jgi:hypothetical protein